MSDSVPPANNVTVITKARAPGLIHARVFLEPAKEPQVIRTRVTIAPQREPEIIHVRSLGVGALTSRAPKLGGRAMVTLYDRDAVIVRDSLIQLAAHEDASESRLRSIIDEIDAQLPEGLRVQETPRAPDNLGIA